MVNPASRVARAFRTPLNASCASERSSGCSTSAAMASPIRWVWQSMRPGSDGVPGEIDHPGAGGNLGGAGLDRLDAVAPDHDQPGRADLALVYVHQPAGPNRDDFRSAVWAKAGLAEARERRSPPQA